MKFGGGGGGGGGGGKLTRVKAKINSNVTVKSTERSNYLFPIY